jgi:PPP family 3-phenylpropionic acid transporter
VKGADRRIQAHYSAYYAAQFILLGVQLPFLSGWLSQEGFSASEIGWLNGASLAARLAFGPAVAVWADRDGNHARALRLVSAIFAAGALGLALFSGKPLIALAAVAVLWSFGLLVPLSDAAIMRADRKGDLRYGEVRAAGSLAFLCTNIIAGAVISRTSLDAAVAIMAAAGAATFLIAMTLRIEPAPDARARHGGWRDALALVREKPFALLVLSAGLIQGSHAGYYSFSILHWTALGCSPGVIGWLWAAGVVAEIILLTRARAFAARFAPAMFVAIGGAGAALRWTLTGLEPPLALLFLVQTMHALSFAAAYLGALEQIDRTVPKRLSNTAMTVMSTTGVGAMTGVATVVSGYLYDAAGAGAVYALCALMGAAGAFGAILLCRTPAGVKA